MHQNNENLPDKVVKASKRVETYSFDTEAWAVLIREAQAQKIEEARSVYEKLVSTFPTSGKYWKLYIEHEIKSRNYEKVEKLFQRCLIKVLSIDLWKTYLHYIKDTKGSLPSYREKMAQAYDFALDKVGMDISSFQIWADYISFLKQVEAVGSYAENQRISAVRKVYQRGVVNPMTNVELLWNQYTSFEQSVNPLIAKKMQEDKGRDYMNARRVTREYEVVTKGLNRNTPSVPPQNTPDEIKQAIQQSIWGKRSVLTTEMHQNNENLPDKVVKASKRVETYSFDTEAWAVLIREAQAQKIEEARSVYEKLVSTFPTSGKYWKLYIEHEIKSRNYEKVEKLFQRCLIKVLSIDLWKTYLHYIKDTKGSLPSYREKMAQAYDFALDKVGMDISSFQIWADYISFLKQVEAVGSYAENQRISAVRKVYQRGVVNPMTNVELLWNQYTSFEQSVNPLIAKKMQEDKGRDYMNARRVTREYEVVTKGLNRNTPSVPPQNTPDEIKQVELWKKYIAWEKANPLRTEDQTAITKRVMYAYEQCLLCLGHHPDIWIEAAAFLEQSSKIVSEKGDQNAGKLFADEAVAIYERAIQTSMKSNELLHFAYADFEESRMKHEKVHSIYKKLATNQETEPTLAYIQYMKFARRAEGIKAARAVFKIAREDARITHHVYVAAALMEYFCSKDKIVAFKIFELGLKKFGQFPDYILQYIDYMGHLNEDNNTRVLFERVLTSGQLEEGKSYDVWNKFLDFESSVGDLSSILKVEKRRATVIGTEFEGRETALLIDRYKFLDLLPCSTVELRSIGYKDLAKQALVSLPQVVPEVVKEVLEDDDHKAKYHMPDVRQMLPYKPQISVPYGAHPVRGGVFPPPPVASLLLSKMPPPESFEGPFVLIDKFLEHMENLNIDDISMIITSGPTAADSKQIDPGTRFSMDIASGKKRKITDMNNGDSGDEMEGSVPPAHDIYRQRQQKKAR